MSDSPKPVLLKQQLAYASQSEGVYAKFSTFVDAVVHAKATSSNGRVVELFYFKDFLGYCRDGVLDESVRPVDETRRSHFSTSRFVSPDDHLGLGDENHSWIRAFERYNARISDEDFNHMIAQIKNDHAYFLVKVSKNCSMYFAHWREIDRVVPVLYNKKRKTVVTILPSGDPGGRMKALLERHPSAMAKIGWLLTDPEDRPPVP